LIGDIRGDIIKGCPPWFSRRLSPVKSLESRALLRPSLSTIIA